MNPARINLLLASCLLVIGGLAALDLDAQTQTVARLPFAKGTIAKLDVPRKLLTLKTREGLETFMLTERTYIFRGKEKITADKLKTGELIALRFITGEQGQLLVQRIKAYTNDQNGATSPPAEPPR